MIPRVPRPWRLHFVLATVVVAVIDASDMIPRAFLDPGACALEADIARPPAS